MDQKLEVLNLQVRKYRMIPLKERTRQRRAELKEELGLNSVMAVPKVTKITLI